MKKKTKKEGNYIKNFLCFALAFSMIFIMNPVKAIEYDSRFTNEEQYLNADMHYINSNYSLGSKHYFIGCGYSYIAQGSASNKVYCYDTYSPYSGYHWATETQVTNGTNNCTGYYIW